MDINSNGTLENGIDHASDVKKLRESRLSKAPLVTTIKIEDDSDDEIEPRYTTSNGVATCVRNGSVETEDKAVQTDNYKLMKMVRDKVQERMKQYAAAAADEKCIFDKQLSPKLEKLERENEELKKLAVALKAKLEEKSNTLKRSSVSDEVAVSPTPPKVPAAAPSMPPPYSQPTPSGNNRSTNNAASSESIQQSRRVTPPRPPPPLLPSSLAQPPRPVVLSQHLPPQAPPQLAPQPPVNGVRQIAPVQAVMRYPYGHQEQRYIIQNMNNVRPMNGTHVVNSNPGLRMTSIPPEMHIAGGGPPIDTRGQAPNIYLPQQHIQHQQQQQQQQQRQLTLQQQQQQQQQYILQQRNNPQMRPSQNAVHPYRQLAPRQLPPPPQQQAHLAQPPLTQPKPPNPPPTLTPIQPPSLPPLPSLTANISTSNNAIVLTWDFDPKSSENKEQYKVECYQLFAHQAKDARVSPPLDTKQWKKIGVVNALPLPMACTLTQFASGSVYFFAVVAVDVNGREGNMSNPCVIRLDVNR